MNIPFPLWIGAVIVGVVILGLAVRIVQQYQGGVVLRFGRLLGVRSPGLNLIIPVVDRIYRIDMRTDYGEIRKRTLVPLNGRVYFCAYAIRNAVYRIISLQKANDREARQYDQSRF